MANDEGTDKLVAPADFDGPTGDRHCTDVLCSVLMIAMWVAMSIVGIGAVVNGDYRIVLYPLDYDGNICGTDFSKDMKDYPYLLFVNSYTGGVCVKECPSLGGLVKDNLTDIRTLVTYDGIWQTDGSELPADYVQVANYSDSADAISCTDQTCFPNDSPEQSWVSQGINEGYGYAYYVGDSYPVLSRCYLTSAASDQIQLLVGANSTLIAAEGGYAFWNNLYADLWTAKAYILGFGFGVALVVSFLYIFLLRLPVLLTFMIWGSIFVSIAMFILAGNYAYNQARKWEDQDPQEQSDTTINGTRISAYVLWVIAALMFLIMFCLRKQIQLAIGCVKETGKAVHRMPIIIFLPVLQGAGFIAFMIIFFVYAVYLASLGQITVEEFPVDTAGTTVAVRTFEFDTSVERSAWYLLFCFFWTSNFIIAVGDMIVAMSVAKWYFTRNKSDVGNGTVLGSIYDTMWYHLGTCAYGSLVLAIIQFIRVILAKIQKTVKEADSTIANAFLCCCQCCLWCFEKCIKFLNKNAYIQTAIFGTSFCKSAREAFFLILRNAGRIGAITYVSGAVLIVGKLFISTVTTGLSYYAMSETIEEDLYSIAGPVVFIFLISYFVSDMFMDVFDMGISTVLQCFIADEEMFDGDECYAEGALQKWIDEYEED